MLRICLALIHPSLACFNQNVIAWLAPVEIRKGPPGTLSVGQFLDGIDLPVLAQKDIVQSIDEGIVLLDPGIIGKIRFFPVTRYRIGTPHGFRGRGPFHPVFGRRPFGVACGWESKQSVCVGFCVSVDKILMVMD